VVDSIGWRIKIEYCIDCSVQYYTVIIGVLLGSGAATSDGSVLRPAGNLANAFPGGRVSVPDPLLRAERGEQHLPLPPDQGAEVAEGRQRHVRGERLHAQDAAVVPAGGVRPRRGLGPPVRGQSRAVRARCAGGRAQGPTPPVVLLSVRQRRAERAQGVQDDGFRGRLPERRGGRGGVHVRAVREVHGQ